MENEPKKRVAETGAANTKLKTQIHDRLDDVGKVLERIRKDIRALEAKIVAVTKHSADARTKAGGRSDKSGSTTEENNRDCRKKP